MKETMTSGGLQGKPYVGNPHKRFDEEVAPAATPRRGSLLYKRTSIIKSIIFAAVALAAGISPERSEHCEAMSLEGCAWADTEKVGDYTWYYRINGNTDGT